MNRRVVAAAIVVAVLAATGCQNMAVVEECTNRTDGIEDDDLRRAMYDECMRTNRRDLDGDLVVPR